MKRHESITPLSRDHHAGLLCCWKIRQGIRKNIVPSRVLTYIQYFWHHHLEGHFKEEETLLFVLAQNEWIEQAVREHRELRERIGSLEKDASPEKLLQFAKQLDDHIRFEERILFPYLEETLSAEQLDNIGRQLQELHAKVKEDDYEDEFWATAKNR